MRMLKCALTLMLSAGVLLALNPFSGKWKMNHQKSKDATTNASSTSNTSTSTKSDVPKDETRSISSQGDQLQVTIVGTDDDGTPIAISYSIPLNGGTGQIQQGGSYNGVSEQRVNDSTRDTTYSKDDKQLTAEHVVVSSDGQTMTVTVKGVDANGNPVQKVLVFDKQ